MVLYELTRSKGLNPRIKKIEAVRVTDKCYYVFNEFSGKEERRLKVNYREEVFQTEQEAIDAKAAFIRDEISRLEIMVDVYQKRIKELKSL